MNDASALLVYRLCEIISPLARGNRTEPAMEMTKWFDSLCSEIEKLSETGYTRSETRDDLRTGKFYFVPDKCDARRRSFCPDLEAEE